MDLIILKSSAQTRLSNDYFDRVTCKQLPESIRRAFIVLVVMKENQLQQQIPTDQ
jgi:hypothetical protein